MPSSNVKLTAQIDATSQGLIDALKKASGAVNDASSNWKDRFASLKDATGLVGQSVKNLSNLVAQVGDIDMDVNGIEHVQGAIADVSSTFSSVKGEIDDLVSKLVEMRNAASSAGMPVDEYQRFAEAVKEAGIPMEEAMGALRSMQEQIQNFANGVPDAEDKFRRLGLTLEDVSGDSVTGNFEAIVNAMQNIVSPTNQAQSSMDMFRTSMENAVTVAQKYNNLLTTQADNTFASDRDVQNAISLSAAIGKLGEQLASVTAQNGKAAQSTKDLNTQEQIELATLEQAFEAQQKYNASLDGVIAKLSGAKSAYETLFDIASNNNQIFDLNKIAGGETDVSDNIKKVIDLLKDEYERIKQIAEIQGNLGAPIDTSYLEHFKDHLKEVQSGIMMLRFKIQNELDLNADSLNTDQVDNLTEAFNKLEETSKTNNLSEMLQDVRDNLDSFNRSNTRLNIEIGTENAQQAIDELRGKLDEAQAAIEGGAKEVHVDTSGIEQAREQIEQLAELTREGLSMELNGDSLAQMSSVGTDVLNTLASLQTQIQGISGELANVNPDAFETLQELMTIATDKASDFEAGLSSTIKTTNDLEVEAGAASESIQEIKDALDQLSADSGIGIDTSQLDVAKEKVDNLSSTVINIEVDNTSVGDLKKELDDVAAKIDEINYKADRNWFEKAWDGAKALGSALMHPVATAGKLATTIGTGVSGAVRGVVSGISAVAHAFAHPVQAARELKQKIDDAVASTHNLKDGMKGAGSETSTQLKQIVGHLIGAGSQVAIIAKGFRMIGDIIKVYWLDGLRNANKELREMQQYIGGSQIKVAEENYKRYESMEEDLKKYMALLDKYKKSGSNVDRVELALAQRKLRDTYGIGISENNAEEVFRQNFATSQKHRVDALESQIRALQDINKKLDAEYADRDSYWKNDAGASPQEKAEGKKRLVEIRKEQAGNDERIMELRAQLAQIKDENRARDYFAQRNAERADERNQAEDELNRAYADAVRRLDEWDASEQEKQINEITQKYLELIKAGVNEADARAVAEKQLAKMLKDEKDKEDRRNRELLDALKQRIDAYKTAYQNYLNSERDVNEARKAYAKTQQDLANDARAERIERKRDRIQKQLAKFGFSLSDDFRLNESGSRRRRRRRNRRLDEQIEEKLQRWQEGRKVRWTGAERRRLRSYQALQRKDRQLEAAQKQMSAADKQTQAAESLRNAAKAIQTAAFNLMDSRSALKDARAQMDEAKAKTGTESQNLTPQQILDRSVTSGLKAPGVGSPLTRNATNYNGQLQTLHRDLQEMQRRYYLVR